MKSITEANKYLAGKGSSLELVRGRLFFYFSGYKKYEPDSIFCSSIKQITTRDLDHALEQDIKMAEEDATLMFLPQGLGK